MLGQEAVSITQIAKDIGSTRQAVYRIKGDLAGAEDVLVLGDLEVLLADGPRTNHLSPSPERVDR